MLQDIDKISDIEAAEERKNNNHEIEVLRKTIDNEIQTWLRACFTEIKDPMAAQTEAFKNVR